MPFLTCLLDVRTLEFFPPAVSWLVNSNFPRTSRRQGGAYNPKTARWNCFILSTFDKHDKTQLLAKFKKHSVGGLQSNLKASYKPLCLACLVCLVRRGDLQNPAERNHQTKMKQLGPFYYTATSQDDQVKNALWIATRARKRGVILRARDVSLYLAWNVLSLWEIANPSSSKLVRPRWLLDVGSTFTLIWLCTICPLQDPVTWYKITHAGEQVAQWDCQNNGRSRWTGTSCIVLEVPLRNLLTSMCDFCTMWPDRAKGLLLGLGS